MLFFIRPLVHEERAGEVELKKRNTLTSCCLQQKLRSLLQWIGKRKVSGHPESRAVCLGAFKGKYRGQRVTGTVKLFVGWGGWVSIAIVSFPGNLCF